MTNYVETLPEVLHGIYDDEVAAMHEQLQAESASDVLSRRRSTEVVPATRETAKYALVKPHLHVADELNPNEGIVSPYPLAIGLSKQMFTRSETTANFSGMRTLAFLNGDHKSKGLMLTSDERSSVAIGDLEPIMDRYARVIENLGWTTVHVAGYSQGGMMAPVLAEALERKGVADVASTLAAEWPNGEDRSFIGLMNAFGKTKPQYIKDAIKASGVDAFVEVANADQGLARYLAGNLRQPNLPLIAAMGLNTFDHNLHAYMDLKPDAHVLLARAGLSAILRAESFSQTSREFADYPNVRSVVVDGFDHALGDFALAEALLISKSIEQSLG